MAAILKLRRGTSIPSLQQSELFYHSSLNTLVVGDGSNSHILLKSGSNTVNTVSISGTVSASYIHVANDLTIKGNIILGDEIANDNITINAELSGSLIPDADNTHDLGTLSKKYRNLYVNSLPGSNIISSSAQISGYNSFLEINGDNVVSSSAQISGYNTFLEINGDSVVSSSAQISGYNKFLEINGDNVVSSSAQISGYNKFLEKDGDSVFSSSVQVNANTITNFDSNVKDKLNAENVISGSSQILHGSNIVSSSAQISGYNKFLEINGDSVVSSSAQIDSLGFLKVNGDNVFSSSAQVNANTITNFDSNVKSKMNSDGVISGSGQLDNVFLEINGDNVVSSSAQISGYNKFLEINGDNVVSGSTQVNSLFVGTSVSTSLDARLDSLESDIHTHSNKTQLDTINQNLSSTSNVTFNTGSFTGDVTITGDFTVLGSATEISSTELRIEDKLITVASGSVDSAAADGAGIEIDGANKSLQWDHNTSQFVFDAQVSSSVGFKGEGGLLTGIDTDQVTEGSNLYYTDVRVKNKINDEGVISGSSQLTSTFDTRYLNTNGDGVISSSAQLTGDLDLRYLEIDGDNVVSSSAQITLANTTGNLDGSRVVGNIQASSVEYSNVLNKPTLFSGSAQVSLSGFSTSDLSEGSNKYYTDTRVKTKLNAENVISGSGQLTSTFDSRYLNTDGDDVISSSAQISHDDTTGFVSNEHIDHSSITLGSGKGLTGGGTIDVSRSITLDTGSAHFVNGVKEKINDEGVISGSSQVSLTSVTGYNSNEHFTQGNITTVGTVTSGDISAILPSGLVSGSVFSSPSQGTVRAQINGVNTDVDTGLQTGDSPTFQGVTLTNLGTLAIGQQTALFSGSAGQIGKRVLGTSAFFNVSASIADDPNSIPTTKAVNDALISAGAGDITEVNPSSVFSDSTTGLIHLSTGTEVGGAKGVQGNIHIAVSTGSAHFTGGVKTKLNAEGVFSSSAQLSADFLDTLGDGVVSSSAQIQNYNLFLEKDGDSVVSGSSQVDVSQTTNYSSINQYSDTKVKTKLNAENVISGSSQLTSAFDSRYLNTNGDSVVSSSAQIDYNSIQNQPTTISSGQSNKLAFISITQAVDLDTLETNVGTNSSKVGYTDALVKAKLNTEGVLSGSAQITNGSGLVSSSAQIDSLGFLKVEGDSVVSSSAQIDYNSIQNQPTTITGGQASAISINTGKVGYTDTLVKAKLNEETVVSGSSQITLSSVTGYNSNEHFTQGNITTLGTVTAGNVTAILPSGVISGSTQLTSNLNSVYLEINGDSVVSGSSQINSLFAGTAVSTSLDSRLDSLESDTHTHSNKANLDTINQNLATTNNVTFADGDFTGDVQINGSLVVQGSATELQVTELRIEDKVITVASGSADSAAADGAGIEIAGANESITWNHANSRFQISDDIHVTGTIKASDDIVAYASSDERLKNNIQPIQNPLEKINEISGNTFDWNEEKQDTYKGKDYGVIAQEIEKILPELVHTKESGFKSVKYDKIIPLLIEGIKDLNKEVIELKKIIKESK